MTLRIIVPVLDEAPTLAERLHALAPYRTRGAIVVVVDGGSADGTVEIAERGADLVLTAPRGRASQQNAGAAMPGPSRRDGRDADSAGTGVSSGTDILLFLHADTHLPDGADGLIAAALDRGHDWGRFDVRIDSPRPLLALVSWSMNWRSHLSGIVTGDQAIFVRRELFERVGGFPQLALMEDVALSKSLKRHGRPARIRSRVITSARRWEQHGAWRTIVLMWRTRFDYFVGADPARLAVRYGYRAEGS